MRPVLITPPATEPVLLAEAKLYLRIDHDDEDDLIRALVTAARQLVEAASGRMLIDQGWRIVLDRWPAGGVLRLPLSPVRQVTGVRVRDAAGAAAELAASALALEIGADPPMLRVEQSVPPPGLPSGGIEIDLLVGFGPGPAQTPEGLRQAMLALCGRWFERRGDDLDGPAARLPAQVMALVQPHRMMRL